MIWTHHRPEVCRDCDERTLVGNGKCSKCHGSGVNLHLTSDEPKCPDCQGSGVCSTCAGTGIFPPGEEYQPEFIKLDLDK